MRVRVRFYGVLKTMAGMGEIELNIDSASSVGQLVGKLVDTIARKEFEAYLIDADLKDPRPNALILVSGAEIGALNGLNTALKDGDEVVLLPVAHGGHV